MLVVGILLFSPSTQLQSSFLSFWLVSFHLVFSVLCAKVTWNVLTTWPFSNITVYFSDSQMKLEMKKNCLQMTYGMSNPLPFPHMMSHSCMWYCQRVCCSLGLFTMTNLNCHSYNSHVTELVKFDAKYSFCLGMYCLKITKPCNFTVSCPLQSVLMGFKI